MQNYLRLVLKTDKNPGAAYKLDPDRSYFGPAKAFPENVVVEADETFASEQPQSETSVIVDNVPDARSVQIRIKYNIVQVPAAGSYMPRIADDRVGYFPDILLNYSSDKVTERQLRYILRWNIARHPMIYYIGNTVPVEYREPIRQALLTWNDAFAKIGFPNTVQVRDQPDDSGWDEDDIRYNVVHWLTQSNSGGYAEAGSVFDPRTGEIIKTSIVIDADLLNTFHLSGTDFAAPARTPLRGFAAEQAEYGAGAHASMAFGAWALSSMGSSPPGQAPPGYLDDFLRYVVLHESGHNWGLQHNFIASQAYSAAQLQSKAFTTQNGLSTSVMAYIPPNIWPKGTPNGAYWQTALGPYDYYAIHWGYATVPDAKTPELEIPTLRQWSSKWSDPTYRFASDEDVDWATGHAIDPRVSQWQLTGDNLSWCEAQMRIGRTLIDGLERRFSVPGETHDPQRIAFAYALRPYVICSGIASHYIGGEYLSRAHVGDPGAALPLVGVPRTESQRAFRILDTSLLDEQAWQLQPELLRSMVYTEWEIGQAPWQYNPPDRHDMPVATIIERLQEATLAYMFQPILLQRLDDASMKYKRGATMSLSDLFVWTYQAVYGDLRNGGVAKAAEIRRNLQQWYVRKLAQMILAPAAGTPYDAQSLSRANLVLLQDEVARAQHAKGLDTLTSAHLASLTAVAHQALSAQRMLAQRR